MTHCRQVGQRGCPRTSESLELSTTPTTHAHIKKAARQSCEAKWQSRWSIAETGRHIFQFVPSVPISHKLPPGVVLSPQSQRVIHQLRSGYVMLNDYKHSIGLSDSPFCDCGQVETVAHYLEECHLHEDTRERLKVDLFHRAGLFEFSAQILLNKQKEDTHRDFRIILYDLLDDFIRSTGRLGTSTSQP